NGNPAPVNKSNPSTTQTFTLTAPTTSIGLLYLTELGLSGALIARFQYLKVDSATLSFTQQPSTGIPKEPLSPAVKVRVEPAASGTVTLSVTGAPAGVTLTGATATVTS